jgi:hypothetical protein
VPTDSTTADNAAQQPAGDPAARLKEVRARVAELRRRIKTERDPKAVAELRAEASKLTEVIAELVRTSGGKADKVKKSDEVVWPRDLSAMPGGPGEWGADPEELGRG